MRNDIINKLQGWFLLKWIKKDIGEKENKITLIQLGNNSLVWAQMKWLQCSQYK